jgi:hypothetical protein
MEAVVRLALQRAQPEPGAPQRVLLELVSELHEEQPWAQQQAHELGALP